MSDELCTEETNFEPCCLHCASFRHVATRALLGEQQALQEVMDRVARGDVPTGLLVVSWPVLRLSGMMVYLGLWWYRDTVLLPWPAGLALTVGVQSLAAEAIWFVDRTLDAVRRRVG